jgi:uncharacterized protein
LRLTQSKRLRIKMVVTCLAVIIALYGGTSVTGAAIAMDIPRLPINGSPASVGLAFHGVTFDSRIDKIPLEGWFLPSSGNAVLVMINGGFQNRIDPVVDTLGLAHDLTQKGYSILLFDLRGRGESGGKAHSLSDENKDIGGAIDYLESRGYPADKIGIIGYCSGAANACLFASQNNIGGLVLDGCFPTVEDMVYNQASTHGIPRLPVDIFLPAVRVAAKVFYGYTEINPIKVVSKVQCPIFFIHEENDDLVSTGDDVALTKASDSQTNMLWQVKNTLHVRAYQNYPIEYVTKVSEFFNSALNLNSD